MEGIMSTGTTEPRNEKRPRNRMVLAVAAALILVVAIGGILATRGSGTEPAPLVLTAEGGGTTMASCLPFDVNILADMSPAFEGTVTELTDSVATLEVDRWYTGGDAETVELHYQPGFTALIGTPDLEVGQTYLITAANGVVNGCGYSGLVTPDLHAAFDQAFGS
jgi:hypothetical protein